MYNKKKERVLLSLPTEFDLDFSIFFDLYFAYK